MMHASATVCIRYQTFLELDVRIFIRSVHRKPEELPSYQLEINAEMDKICGIYWNMLSLPNEQHQKLQYFNIQE